MPQCPVYTALSCVQHLLSVHLLYTPPSQEQNKNLKVPNKHDSTNVTHNMHVSFRLLSLCVCYRNSLVSEL